MSVNEFIAWLDGFDNAIDDAPTKKQWETIKEKVKDIKKEKDSSTPLSPIPAIQPALPSQPIWVIPEYYKPYWQITCENISNCKTVN